MANMRYPAAIAAALAAEMERDDRVFVAGEDIRVGSIFGTMRGIHERFGDRRVLATPISEAGIAGLATGAALAGLRPVVEIMFMDFMTLAIDQIANQMAKIKYMSGGEPVLPVVVMTNGGAGVRSGAQHSQSLEAWLCHVPGLKVVMPSTARDAAGLLTSAIRDDNPVVYIVNKRALRTQGDVPDVPFAIPLGQAEVKREGADVTVVATGFMVHDALAAADTLAERGIDVEVVDPRTLSPLDTDTIVASVQKTGRAVVAHEAVQFAGLGAEIAAQIQEHAFDYLDAPVRRVGAPFVPVPFSPALEDLYLPSARSIVDAVEAIVPARA